MELAAAWRIAADIVRATRSSVRVFVRLGRRRRDIVGERGRVLVNHGRIDTVNLHLALDLRVNYGWGNR